MTAIMRKAPLAASTALVLMMGWTALQTAGHLSSHWLFSWEDWRHLVLGATAFAGLVVALMIFRVWGSFRFLSVLEHELVHVLFAYLTASGVRNISVSDLGSGFTNIERPNFLVKLAPYLVSTPLLAVLLIYLLGAPDRNAFLEILLGAACSYYLLSLVRCVRPRQVDFQGVTFPVALLWICSWLIIISGVVTGLAEGGKAEAVRFLDGMWGEGVLLFRSIL